MNEETVTISKKEYENLKEDARWLRYLEEAGVDCWAGFIAVGIALVMFVCRFLNL